MLEALEEHFGGKATWTRPQGGLFIWATLDGGVDTTDLLAHSEGVAFVPGRAAYMDGRSGASSMRLNFAGVPEEDIREGVRRIGRVMGGQAGLFGVLTGSLRRPPGHRLAAPMPTPSEPTPTMGTKRRARAAAWRTSSSCRSRSRAAGSRSQIGRRAAGSMSGGAVKDGALKRSRAAGPQADGTGARQAGVRRVAVLKGGTSLERKVSLRSGAQAQGALGAAGARRGGDRRGPAVGRAAARGESRRGVHRVARLATARTAPCRGCWRRSGSPTPARGPPRACAAPTRCSPST